MEELTPQTSEESLEQDATISEEQEGTIDTGELLFSWDVWEYPPVERSSTWYVGAAAIGGFMLLYGVFTANYLFSILVVLFALFIVVRDIRKPQRMQTYITSRGIIFQNALYPYEDIYDFSIVYQPPTVKNLYISFSRAFNPPLSIPIEDANPNLIRAALLSYLRENLNNTEETLTDRLRRVYKL